ncbi:hypothetical protein [Sideroxydans sp. CL21]|nr:hypothetical protein [Sideroxydans sp. CL21]
MDISIEVLLQKKPVSGDNRACRFAHHMKLRSTPACSAAELQLSDV